MPPKNNIDNIRMSERARINEEIRQQTKYNDIDQNSLTRFRGINNNDNYTLKQVEKLSKAIEERTNKINELNDRLLKLENGELDNEILENIKKNTEIIREKDNQHKEKIKLIKEEKKQDSEFGKKMHLKEVKSDKLDKSYYYDSSYKHFLKAADTLPDYMEKDLRNMPNNEGYIWKNVYFYGLRDNNNNGLTTITENRKGYKIIHRWTKTRYTIHEKPNKSYEKLIKDEPRRIIN